MKENIEPYQIEENINPRVYFKLLFKAWKWYAFSFTIFIILGLAFLRYSTSIYKSESTIIILEDDENMILVRDAVDHQDKYSLARKTEAEAVILKSRFLLERVVKNHELNIQIFSLTGRTELKTTESYTDPAFAIYRVNQNDSSVYLKKMEFVIEPINSASFELTGKNKKSIIVNINDTFTIDEVSFQLLPNTNYKEHWLNYKYKVVIKPIDQEVTSLQQKISINDEKLEIGVLFISLNGPTPEKNNNVIDALVQEYISSSIYEKNKVILATNDFINERIKLIEKELSMIESSGEMLKQENDVVDINIEYSSILLKQNELDKQIINTEVQFAVVKYVHDYINETGNKLVPVNLGLVSTPLVKAITAYNTLFTQFTQLKESTGIKNPKKQSIKQELASSKANLQKSMNSLMLSQKLRLEELKSQYALGESKIALLPRYERQQRNIDRHKQIIETLYLFLLQKKEENEIILASTIADGRVIDKAFSSPNSISPNKRIVYVLIMVMSLLIPSLGLYLKHLFNNKVRSADEFQKYKIPVIGSINHSSKEIAAYSRNSDNVTSASFRMLRVNLNLLFETNQPTCKTLLITSLNPKEGKTFTALNLGRSFADIDKKVLVIDIDLRYQGLAEQLQLNTEMKGVSDYVLDETIAIKDIVVPSKTFDKLSLISSGPTPLNPSELLNTSRIEQLINEAKNEYDYVIIDARSIDLANDTLLLVKHADMTLLVCKAGKLMTDELKTICSYNFSKRLGNMQVVFNEFKKNISSKASKTEAKHNWKAQLMNKVERIIKRK
jgi:tyrosine-protein kinase Etk/Wzc